MSPKHLYTLHFDIVNGCQLRCVGCPNSTLEPKIQRISIDDFDLCMGNIDVERIHTLRLFNYGEPLLHTRQIRRVMKLDFDRGDLRRFAAVEQSLRVGKVHADEHVVQFLDPLVLRRHDRQRRDVGRAAARGRQQFDARACGFA